MLLEEYERQEQNLADLDDTRFGEIYVDDRTPSRKEMKCKQITKMRKEKDYDYR